MFCEYRERERERNLPYANVTYNLFLLSTGAKRPLIDYKKRKSLLAL